MTTTMANSTMRNPRPSFQVFEESLRPVDLCTDCFFLCDCARVFNTGWVTADNKLYYARRDIARLYAQSWLAVDFGSSVPYGTVLKLVTSGSSAPAWIMSSKKMVKVRNV